MFYFCLSVFCQRRHRIISVEDVNIRSKFYKIVLDIYKNEKLDKQEKAFLSGFIEGILEYDENIDDAKDLKAEMQAAIK